VVHDGNFAIAPSVDSTTTFDAASWKAILQTGVERYLSDEIDRFGKPLPLPSLHDDWLTEEEKGNYAQHSKRDEPKSQRETSYDLPHLHSPESHRELGISAGGGVSIIGDRDGAPPRSQPPLPRSERPPATHTCLEFDDAPPSRPATQVPVNDGLRRGMRRRKTNPKYNSQDWAAYQETLKQKFSCSVITDCFLQSLDWDKLVKFLKSANFLAFTRANHVNRDPEDGSDEWVHPFSLVAQAHASSADTPNCYQSMNGVHAEGYKEAMQFEYDIFLSKHAWTEVKIEKWTNMVPITWAIKCKRYPDGSVRKLKARLCVCGDTQVEGVDYFDTYAPVVTCTIVQILLILSLILGLAITQVDYTASFVHAGVGEDVYIEMPKSSGKPGIVLKLCKSVYGLKQSPHNFFHHLRDKLHDVGFSSSASASASDPCIFISDKAIALVYVDDTLCFSPKQEHIADILLKLKANGLDLNIEEDTADFFGVHVGKNPNGSIELTQIGLTDRIISTLGLEQDKSTGKSTPSEYGCLGTNADDDVCDETFNYRSVAGMMQYLSGHIRPDIAFPVSQCDHFSSNPKQAHDVALNRIGRYLLQTRDRGLLSNPLDSFKIECFVDADFAGL
jgi:hypothetical protein